MFRTLALLVMLAASVAAQAEIRVKDGERIAFLGDSITQLGQYQTGFVNLVMEGLKDAGVKNLDRIDAGASGNRFTQMLGRIDGVLAKKPDRILISCGVNDVWHREHIQPDGRHTGVDLPDYIKNMREMYDRADKAGAKVVVLTSTLITDDRMLLHYYDRPWFGGSCVKEVLIGTSRK